MLHAKSIATASNSDAEPRSIKISEPALRFDQSIRRALVGKAHRHARLGSSGYMPPSNHCHVRRRRSHHRNVRNLVTAHLGGRGARAPRSKMGLLSASGRSQHTRPWQDGLSPSSHHQTQAAGANSRCSETPPRRRSTYEGQEEANMFLGDSRHQPRVGRGAARAIPCTIGPPQPGTRPGEASGGRGDGLHTRHLRVGLAMEETRINDRGTKAQNVLYERGAPTNPRG